VPGGGALVAFASGRLWSEPPPPPPPPTPPPPLPPPPPPPTPPPVSPRLRLPLTAAH